jgi:hypothetical protein
LQARPRNLLMMNSDVPVIKKVAWHYVIVQVTMMAGLILLLWKLVFKQNFDSALLWGASIYLIYSFGARYIVLKRHRAGIGLTARSLFAKAIEEFKASYAFLTQHAWLDRFRLIALLSSSAFSYREMALCNIAYSFLRLDNMNAAKDYYKRAEAEFPGSALAIAGLQYIERIESEQILNS